MTRLVAILALLWASQAAAQTNCADRTIVAERLTAKYNEHRIGTGVKDEFTLFEVWASPKGETWTILKTQSNGISCIMAFGFGWYVIDAPAPGEDG